jgi:hypothetical protein
VCREPIRDHLGRSSRPRNCLVVSSYQVFSFFLNNDKNINVFFIFLSAKKKWNRVYPPLGNFQEISGDSNKKMKFSTFTRLLKTLQINHVIVAQRSSFAIGLVKFVE